MGRGGIPKVQGSYSRAGQQLSYWGKLIYYPLGSELLRGAGTLAVDGHYRQQVLIYAPS